MVRACRRGPPSAVVTNLTQYPEQPFPHDTFSAISSV
jgi:hypothetical protein